MKVKLAEGIDKKQLLLNVYGASAHYQEFDEALRGVRNSIDLSDPKNNYSVVGAYTSVYQRVSRARQHIITEVEKVMEYYLVDVILQQMTEDSLAPELGTGRIFTVNYAKDERIDKILKKMSKDLDLDNTVVNTVPDMLAQGEYVLETKIDSGEEEIDQLNDHTFDRTEKDKKYATKGKGVVALRDTVEQGTVISLAQDGRKEGYLALSYDKTKVIKRANSKYVQFVFSGAKKRIKLEQYIPELMSRNKKVVEILKELPRYVRIGKSIIYPFIDKFKELELLEKLIPATKLSKLSNVNLLGIQVPSKFNLEDGFNAAKRMEGYINNKVGVDERLGEITVESILSVAGRSKVLPLFGDKGTIEKIDHNSDEPEELLSSSREIREIIFDSIGIPFELIYKSDSDSKAETLKRYARYLRKLKNIQRSVSEAIKGLCCIHLTALGETDFDEDEIEIDFLNKLIEIDNLDKLEHADVTINFLNNIVNFFNDLSQPEHPMSKAININAVADYVDRQLRTIGLHDAIDTQSEGGDDLDKRGKGQEEE